MENNNMDKNDMDGNYIKRKLHKKTRNKDDNNIEKKEMKVYSGQNPNTSFFHLLNLHRVWTVTLNS